ncbi:hypothetical protein MMC12_007827 [Toensbergia leucococca]|nr:hypothetical protein [Toensbergia leucococca]
MPEQLQSTFNFQNNTPPSQSSTQATSPISEPYASPGNRTSSISYQESRRGRSFLMLDQFRSEELHLSRTSNAESSNRNSESHRWTPSGLSPTPAPKDLVPLHTTGKPESLHTMGNRASTTASIVAKNLTQVPENESQSRSTSYRPSTLAPPSLSLDIPNHRFSIPIRLADETERLESRILSPRPPVTPPTITTAILDSFNPDSATSTSTITQSPVHHSAPSSHYPAQTVKILFLAWFVIAMTGKGDGSVPGAA